MAENYLAAQRVDLMANKKSKHLAATLYESEAGRRHMAVTRSEPNAEGVATPTDIEWPTDRDLIDHGLVNPWEDDRS